MISLKSIVFESNINEFNVDEAKVSVSDASSLCLYRKTNSNNIDFVLYDGEVLKKFVLDDMLSNNPTPIKLIAEATIKGLATVGYSNKCESYMMQYSAAVKGYGPLMYEIAMSLDSKQTWLTSDKGAVSDDAFNVWKKFADRKDVLSKEILNPKCKTLMQDEETDIVLNKKYTLESPIDYNGLVQNYKNNVDEIIATAKTNNRAIFPEQLDKYIKALSNKYFEEHYDV